MSISPAHERIDLDRHGLIDASAGTGKTFTLQNLIVRLLRDKGVSLSEILVLTFTEKATAELKTKIRQQLALDIPNARGEPQRRLSDALDKFDEAQIYTIHGFCQHVLQTYAFENNECFSQELARDDDVLPRVLRQIETAEWPALYGARLAELLELSDFPGKDGAWGRRVIRIAQLFHGQPEPADVLIPSGSLDCVAAKAEIHAALNRLAALVGPINAERIGESPLVRRYAALKIRHTHSRMRDGLLPLLRLLQSHKKEPLNLSAAAAFFDKIKKFELLCIGTASIPEFQNILSIAVHMRTRLAHLREALAAAAIPSLKRGAAVHKQERGVLSFDDMLVRLNDALDASKHPERAPALLERLQQRFRYACVDEAQDTDRVQWDILRRIFVDGAPMPPPGSPLTKAGRVQRLFLIGDRKQAIYGFRGADVAVYLAAEKALNAAHAQRVALDVSYRSEPRLLEAFNTLFAQRQSAEESWFPPAGGISYSNVNTPADPPAAARDETQLAPLVFVNLQNAANATEARNAMSVFIASRIKWLLNSPGEPRLALKRGGKDVPLQASDLAVLVRNKTEARPVEAALRNAGIPFTYYKKQGLYQSEEAAHLLYVLDAVANPGDGQALRKALLTPFFNGALGELDALAGLPPESRLKLLLARWRSSAARREWPAFFLSILEDTGVILPNIVSKGGVDVDRERRITNYQHILEELELAARRAHLDLSGVITLLQRLRTHGAEGDMDAGLHRLESDRAKVQLMTMHSCKGLEFPVVFIAGGFTNGLTPDYYKFHDESGRLVYDLAQCDAGNKERHQCEEDAESRRLYYVAFTRAQFKLFVPLLAQPNKPSAAALPGFVARAAAAAFGPNFNRSGACLIGSVLQSVAQGPSMPGATTSAPRLLKASVTKDGFLAPENAAELRARALTLESYSSLKHGRRPLTRAFGDAEQTRSAIEHEGALIPSRDDPSRDREGADVVGEVVVTKPLPDGRGLDVALPGGTEMGSFLHYLLENIDYDEARAATASEQLAASPSFIELMSNAGVGRFAAHKGAIAGLLFRALRTPLDGALCLGNVPRADRLHELAFHFPLPTTGGLFAKRAGRLTEGKGNAREGFLIGFIDLVYRRKDASGAARYGFIDWKSDRLAGYGRQAMQAHMDAMGYTLQYKLYSLALSRWLAQCNLKFDACFDGIHYVFLRGIGADPANPRAGIFTVAEKPDLAAWQNELYTALNGEAATV